MSIRLDLKSDDAERIVTYIKGIAGNVSANDIVEIVLKTPETEREKPQDPPGVVMTSREVADILGRPHTTVVKQIAKYLCERKTDGKNSGFVLTSFVCSHRNRKSYPMYELTEEACKVYRNLVAEYGEGIKSVADGLVRFDRAIEERFHPVKKMGVGVPVGRGFLLEGRSRTEYEEYCNIFDQFIAGPAAEGREISELTEKYQKFYEVMKAIPLKVQESNMLEDALYGVAIEAEMQGFIYGFKLLDALLDKQLPVAV